MARFGRGISRGIFFRRGSGGGHLNLIFYKWLFLAFKIGLSFFLLVILRRIWIRWIAKRTGLAQNKPAIHELLKNIQKNILQISIAVNSLNVETLKEHKDLFTPSSFPKSWTTLKKALGVDRNQSPFVVVQKIAILSYTPRKTARVFLECNVHAKLSLSHFILNLYFENDNLLIEDVRLIRFPNIFF